MNILVFSWRGPNHPQAGGAEKSTWNHIKFWSKAGHRVTLFTSRFKNYQRFEEINGVNVIRFGNQYLGVHICAFFWYIFGQKNKYDIIVDEFHGIPFFAPLFVNKPIVAFIHELAQPVWMYNTWSFPFNFIIGILGKIIEPYIIKFNYRDIPFMTVSESTKNDLANLGVRNIFVVLNGIDHPDVSVSRKIKKKLLVYLGAIAKDKGIEDAIKTYGLVYKHDKSIMFMIAGSVTDKYKAYLKSLIDNEKIPKGNINFLGFISDKQKYKLLSDSYLLINPSKHEGWGLVNLEANLFGTPVVGYKVGGMVDSVINGKTGILVENNDYQALSKAIIYLFENKQEYIKYQKEAVKWSQKYNWNKSGSESLCILEKQFSLQEPHQD